MLSTPSSGVVRLAPEPVPLSCPECGQPTPNCGIWNRPDYRCRNPQCLANPFTRAVSRQQVGQGAQGEGVGGLHSKNFGPAPTFNEMQVA